MAVNETLFGQPSAKVAAALAAFDFYSGELSKDAVRQVPDVLDIVRQRLESDGWRVARGARSGAGIALPTSGNGSVLADAWHPSGVALWIETGRAWNNFGFLQHVVEAAMAPGVVDAMVAVVHKYNAQPTFERCRDFLEHMTACGRPQLPYRSLTLVGF